MSSRRTAPASAVREDNGRAVDETEKMTSNIFVLMNIVGLLAFAVVGALKAIDDDLDLFGVVVLGITTALGGGTTRDLLVDRVPQSLLSMTDMGIALIGVIFALVGARLFTGLADHPAVQVSDAVGLAAFATTGALVGDDTGVSLFGIVILAAMTGVGGGAIADLLLGKTPFVLKEDFYATCAVVGGFVFWMAITIKVDEQASAIICAASVLGLRLLALHHGWRLPTGSRLVDV